MLYDGEKVPVWDPETGDNMGPQLEQEAQNHIDESIEEARNLKSMTKTPGWNIVKQFLGGCKEQYIEVLKNSQDFDQIRRLQEAIRAYDNVQAYVQRLIQMGEDFEQQRTPQKEG